VGDNGGSNSVNHTIVYDNDESPFQLKANHPHGVMTAFSLNRHINDFKVDLSLVLNNLGVYYFDTFSSPVTDSNSLINYWTIQFIQKPAGIPTSFDSNLSNIVLNGPITDSDVVWFTDTNDGPADQTKNEFILTASGSTVNAYQMTDPGDGFSPLVTPLVTDNSNGYTTSYPLVTSHDVNNGRIADFIINAGGSNYLLGDKVYLSSPSSTTNAVLSIETIRDGMIAGITINNGGQNYTLNDTLTIESAGGGNGALLQVLNIDNGHINSVELVEEGSGFVAGETLTLTHSRDSNLPYQPTVYIGSISTSENESILSKIKDLNDALEQ